MTEEEAKTKWCPFARATSASGHAAWNRISDHEGTPDRVRATVVEATRCVGGMCMAWRVRERYSHAEESNAATCPEGEGWMAADDGGWVRAVHTPVGFCGLTGAPQ